MLGWSKSRRLYLRQIREYGLFIVWVQGCSSQDLYLVSLHGSAQAIHSKLQRAISNIVGVCLGFVSRVIKQVLPLAHRHQNENVTVAGKVRQRQETMHS